MKIIYAERETQNIMDQKGASVLIVSSNSTNPELYLGSNVYKVIKLSNNINPEASGVPTELIYSACPSIVKKKHLSTSFDKKHSPKIIVYDIPIESDFPTIQRIIQCLNLLTDLNIIVITNHKIALMLKPIINHSIKIIERSIVEAIQTSPHLILSSGASVLEAILNKIPTIVIGTMGLGGVVNQENFQKFLRSDFQGRIGGVYNEIIPSRLFLYEIQRCLGDLYNTRDSNENFQSHIEETYAVAKKYYDEYNLEDVLTRIEPEVIRLHYFVKNKTRFQLLKPKLCQNISITQMSGKNTFHIRNNVTNKIAGIIGRDELSVIRNIDGTKRIKDLSKDISEVSVTNFIRELWHQKIVCFSVLDI